MNGSKPWWQSSTIWFAIIGILITAYMSLDGVLGFLPDIPEWLLAVLGILTGGGAINGRVRARTKVQ